MLLKASIPFFLFSLILLIGCVSNYEPSNETQAVEQVVDPAHHTMETNTIQSTLASFEKDFSSIPSERKELLSQISEYVFSKVSQGDTAKLTFICTHNSRRSHLSQIWAQTAAAHYGIDKVETFSGGTEATAFNPRAVRALKRNGFPILEGDGDNPVYEVQFADNKLPLKCFSKKYDDAFNPQNGFCAVMTCSSADEACPIVFGAEQRVSTPYIDPKISDDTPQEDSTYTARSHEIGTELTWAMHEARKKLDQISGE